MHGNVWEWTCSVYESYGKGEEQGCGSKNSNEDIVLRGASWLNEPSDTRSALRDYYAPQDLTYVYIGFRIVRTS